MLIDQEDFVCSGTSCKPITSGPQAVFKRLQQGINSVLYVAKKQSGMYPHSLLRVDGIIGTKTKNAAVAAVKAFSARGILTLTLDPNVARWWQQVQAGLNDVNNMAVWASEVGDAFLAAAGSVPSWAKNGQKSPTTAAPSNNAPGLGIPWWALAVGGLVIYKVVK